MAISHRAFQDDAEDCEDHSLFQSLSEVVRHSAARAQRECLAMLAASDRSVPSGQGRVGSSVADLYRVLEKEVDSILRTAGLAR